MRIAFYAPLKHPDHPMPSGDRTIARELREMLVALGHEVGIASHLRTWTVEQDPPQLRERLLSIAQIKALTLIERYKRHCARPDLWFTYHVYTKSPDLLGPLVTSALNIPYVVAEATVHRKHRLGPWRGGLALARAALRRCDAIFYNKPKDIRTLEPLVTCPLLYLPPSVDLSRFAAARPLDLGGGQSGPVIASLAMWRDGRKADSLKLLAQALTILQERTPKEPWVAVIGGDGPAAGEIKAAFAALPPGRVRFFGLVSPEQVPSFLKGCDIFAFPGLREPPGLVFLEAQAAGRPVVAVRNSGIATMVSPEGALLVDSPDPQRYADALAALLTDPERRKRMGEAALKFVATERSRTAVQARLAEGLAAAIEYHKKRRR